METVHDDLMIMKVVNRMISNYPTNKIASGEKALNILKELIQNKQCRRAAIFLMIKLRLK